MRTVVPYLIPYKFIFYLEFLEQGRQLFIQINSIRFEKLLNNSEATL
jgi:hypothetical protein